MRIQRFLPLGLILLCGCSLLFLFPDSSEREIPKDQGTEIDINVERENDRMSAQAAPIVELDEFEEWVADYLSSPGGQRVDVEKVRSLAEERGKVMLELIKSDPRQALEKSLRWHEWVALPVEIQSLVERPFSVTGDFEHISNCSPEGDRTKDFHPFSLHFDDGRDSEIAHVYGRRKTGLSEAGTPLHGITLAGHSALWDSPALVLNSKDYEAVKDRFPRRNEAEEIGTDEFAALIGGEVYYFSSDLARDGAIEMIAAAEALHGPDGARMALAAAAEEDDEFDIEAGQQAGQVASSQWTETTRNVWVFRIRFWDTSYPDNNIASRVGGASGNISAQSFSKTSLNLLGQTDIALPNSQFSYTIQRDSFNRPISRNTAIRNAVQTAATNMGINTTGTDFFVYQFSRYASDNTPASALLGGADHWVNGNRIESIWVHEFGHQYGLGHANYRWGLARGTYELSGHENAGDSNVEHWEYGDQFDIMGPDRDDGVYPNGHFHARGKALLNWIPASAVHEATKTGTYGIDAFDHAGASTSSVLALRVKNRFGDVFWVGYRANFPVGTGKKNAHLGATIVREIGSAHHVIDATPWSQSLETEDVDDAALPVGQSWTDATGTLRIKVLGTTGTLPNKSLNIQVSMTAPCFEVFPTKGATLNGLVGSYVNSVVSATDEPDWRLTRTIAGTRIDRSLDFTSGASWGSRADVGLTAGTDANWDDFSAQWDGYLKVNYPLKLRTRSADGSRILIDYNQDNFLNLATETVNNNWPDSFGSQRDGEWSALLQPGSYKFRVQYRSSAGSDRIELDVESPPLFDFSTDAAGTQPGLDGSYINESLRGNTAVDWTTQATVGGTRVDRLPFFRSNDWSHPDNSDPIFAGLGNWNDFSVQWDGYITINRPLDLRWRSDDTSNLMVDQNRDGSFAAGDIFRHPVVGENFGPTVGTFHPGTYPIRLQFEEGEDSNKMQLFGRPKQDDHGNDPDFASVISESLAIDGELTANDKDYFRFDVTKGITLEMGSTGGTDTFGTLRTVGGTVIDSDDDDGPGSNFAISATLQPGTYILEVKGFNTTTAGNYGLTYRQLSPQITLSPNGININIDRGQSTADRTVTLTNTGDGLLNYTVNFSSNWWATESVNVGTLPAGESQDIVLSFDTSTLGGGSFYSMPLAIEDVNDPSAYESITVSVNINGFGDDHGGRPQSAKTLPADVGVTQEGDIEVGFDEDWFEFVVTEPRTLETWTTGPVDTIGTLYDAAGNALLPNNDDAGGVFFRNFRLVRALSPGTYYVGVSSYSNNIGDYLLHANFHPGGLPFSYTNPVLAPGDPIIPIGLADGQGSSSPPSGNEEAAMVIDRRFNTKYLNFGRENTGFIVTPNVGPEIVRGFVMVTANDEENRDPVAWELFGTNDTITSTAHSEGTSESWTSIATGTLNLPAERGTMGFLNVFQNPSPYQSYKLLVTSVKGPGANSMQVAEVQFITAADLPATEVNTLADSGAGSLREVIANLPDGAAISFSPALDGGVLRLDSGQIQIDRTVQMDASALPFGLTIQGNGAGRIFYVSSGSTLHLIGVNLTGGNTVGTGVGGAIASVGDLTIENAAIYGNRSNAGGAIYTQGDGKLTLRNVTFTQNFTTGFGGAIRLVNATNEGLIESCTISGNRADIDGGGVSSGADLVVRNTIITGNSAGAAAQNFHNPGVETYDGRNLIDVDARLGAFGLYIGATPVMPPTESSPALNAATSNLIPVFDQNGFPRIDSAEVGAAEFVPIQRLGFSPSSPFDPANPTVDFSVVTTPGLYIPEISENLAGFFPQPNRRVFASSTTTTTWNLSLIPENNFIRVGRFPQSLHGLRAYWDFEGDSKSSPFAMGDPPNSNRLDASAMGNAFIADNGILGRSASFDGDGDYFEIGGEVVEDNPDSDFTVSAWFMANSAPSGSTRHFVFETKPNYTISLGVREGTTSPANTKIQFYTNTSTSNPFIDHEVPDADFAGQLFHAVVIFDSASSTLTAYVNGVAVGTASITGTLNDFDGFHLGTHRAANDRWFDGMIDEVAVWERALSPGEIALLFNGGSPTPLVR